MKLLGKQLAAAPQKRGAHLSAAPAPSVKVRAPGKVNLALHVGECGADGYHKIVTLFQAVDLYEVVTASYVPVGRG
ncbi:MAG: hypothetical protein LBB58_01965, partial [Cellulomonadaceae bacterium]|nr:hypothetical protein [Cellulomonadaceae bacterium]